MGKSLRQVVESIVFAGLKPGEPRAVSNRMRWLGPYSRLLDRFLKTAAPDDPFYLTNRTWGERVRVWVLISLPIVVVAIVVGWGVFEMFEKSDVEPKELTGPQIAAKMLPDLNKPMDFNVNTDLEVLEVHVEQGTTVTLVGEIRNTTDHAVEHSEVSFDLADARGSRLGAVSVPVEKVAPKTTVSFRLPIQQRTAVMALRRAQ